MRPALAVMIVAGLYALHQDVWWWREARPVLLGVFPIGLFYHAAYTVATSLALVLLVRLIWPAHLDTDTAVSPHE